MLRKNFTLIKTFGVETTRIITGSEIVRITRCLATQKKANINPEDQFGTLSAERNLNRVGDEIEDEPKGDYFGVFDTLNKMKACLDAHEYNNAKELLRVMQQRTKAPTLAYKILMKYNAKMGNIKEAFHLYNDYKKRGYYVRGAMYTSLFTACGNCPRSDIALPIAYKLAKYLFESKDTKPNLTNHHAMLKAFGRHGDLSAAFQLVDRLNSRNAKVTTETYNMLLEACISDRAAGLRFALLVWHQMLKRGMKPDLYTFRNLAKCAHTCGVGDIELVLDLVRMIVGNDKFKNVNQHHKKEVTSLTSPVEAHESHMLSSGQATNMESSENSYILVENYTSLQKIQFIPDGTLENESSSSIDSTNEIKPNEVVSYEGSNQIEQTVQSAELCNTSNSTVDEEVNIPNLLEPEPECGSLISFGDLTRPENRFMLYGGLKGFFKVMEHFEVKPDIKLFSMLLQCISQSEEEELMELMKKYKVRRDIRFVNVLLKKRLWWGKGQYSFQECVDTVNGYKMKPNLDTLRIFAEACTTREEGQKCIQIARDNKITFSEKFLFPMLICARRNNDLDYISDVITAAKEEGTAIGPRSLAVLQTAVNERKELAENHGN